jgi:peptidoglycan/LPS O-acetylase OafA/YrhL
MDGRREKGIPSLDGFRALSIFLVIAAHASMRGDWGSLGIPAGDLGVRFFFAISGFLITYLLLLEKRRRGAIDLRSFYLRRALRILPVYFVFAAMLTIVALLSMDVDLSECEFLTMLTFTKDLGCHGWLEGHLWSLSVEAQFYFIWPILLSRLRLRNAVTFAVIAIFLAPLSRGIEHYTHQGAFWLTSNSDALMLGCLAAILRVERCGELQRFLAWRPATVRAFVVAGIAIFLALSHYHFLRWFTVTLTPTLQALAAAYLICSYAFIKGGFFHWLLNSPVVVYVGALSYSLYIWQQPFFYAWPNLGLLAAPTNLLLIFTVAVASYHLLELPFSNLRSRLRRFHSFNGAQQFSAAGTRP